MARGMMVEESANEQPDGVDVRNRENLNNIRINFGKKFAMEWKCYEGRMQLPPSLTAKPEKAMKHFLKHNFGEDNPCPAPVRIDETKGWTRENVRACNHTITDCTPEDAFARAVVHGEEHWLWWYDTECEKTEKALGKPGPPMSTKIKFRAWENDEYPGMDPGLSDMDKKIHKARLDKEALKELNDGESEEGIEVGSKDWDKAGSKK